MANFVKCLLCKREFRRINNFHLRICHGLDSVEDYLDLFPGVPTIGDSLRTEISETAEKAWKNPNRAPYSQEHRDNISKELKSAWALLTPEEYNSWCENISRTHIGVPQTEEHVRKRVEGRAGYTHSEETIRKIGEALTGIPKSEDHRNALSDSLFGKYIGEKNPHWKGGYDGSRYGYGWWAIKEGILERDNYTCQGCGTKLLRLVVHHIDGDKENITDYNLVTVCYSCNTKASYDEKYWQDFYGQLLEEKYGLSPRSEEVKV